MEVAGTIKKVVQKRQLTKDSISGNKLHRIKIIFQSLDSRHFNATGEGAK